MLWLWIALVLAVALALAIGVERLISRLGVKPEDPDAAKGGVAQLAESLERWAAQRSRRE